MLPSDASEFNSGDWRPLLDFSFAWGSGTRGYGPARLARVHTAGGARLGADLAAAAATLARDGAAAAYELLLGERRIAHPGPAFFTEFRYFQDPSALILDARLARRLRWFS